MRGVKFPYFLAAIILASGAIPRSAEAELTLSVYGGGAWYFRSNVHIEQSPGTDITLHGVSWRGESFQEPLYSGARAFYWWSPEWGAGLEFTHAKMLATNSQVVEVSGSRAGVPVAGREPLQNTVRELGFSHGLNMVLADLHRRWEMSETFQLYAGLGVGVLVPHGEGKIGDVAGDAYHFGGWALGGQAGAQLRVLGPLSVFVEYKLQHLWINMPYSDTTQVATKAWNQQVLGGLSVSLFE